MKTKQTKIRVCRITDSFPPPWAGLNTGTYELSRAQAAIGIDLEVITKYRRGANDVDNKLNFKVHRINAKSFLFDILALYKFIILHRQKKYDILHTHGTSAFLFHLFRKHLLQIPIVVSVHCVRKEQFKILRSSQIYEKLQAKLNERLLIEKLVFQISIRGFLNPSILKERICFHNADKLLPVSQGLALQLKDNYNLPSNKIHVVYNGVDVQKFSTSNHQMQRINESSDDLTILFIGRLDPGKNLLDLLEAYSLLIKEQPNIKLLFIGNGSWKSHLISICKNMKIIEHVEFLENVHYDRISYFYHQSDILVLPSYYEGLSKVLLEGMACGIPIITTNISGNNELIRHGYNGYLVDPDAPLDLAQKISYMLNNPSLLYKMLHVNRRNIENQFSWKKIAASLTLIYKILLKPQST